MTQCNIAIIVNFVNDMKLLQLYNTLAMIKNKTSIKLGQLHELKKQVVSALLSLADLVDTLNESIKELEKRNS